MLVGVPKEIKNHEYRVGLTPGAIREYVAAGHKAIVETNAGAGIGASDDVYRAAGADIVDTAEEVFARAEMVVKVKEPQPSEWVQLREGQILFTYLHLAPDPEQAKGLMASGVIAGYEAKLDLRRLGHGTIVHIKIALGSQRAEALEAFERAVADCPSVVRCDLMSGTDDYLVTVLARSLDHFAEIHRSELSHLPGVVRMESGFVLREVVKPRLPPALMPKGR